MMRLVVVLTFFIGFFYGKGQDSLTIRQPVFFLADSTAVLSAPSFTADGKTMVFSSERKGVSQIFSVQMDSLGYWSKLTQIPLSFSADSTVSVSNPFIAAEGNVLLFDVNGRYKYDSDIYMSIRNNEGWSAPLNLGQNINTDDYEGFPSLSTDGKHLYFARAKKIESDTSFRERGYIPCSSLFKSSFDSTGNWGLALKLPPVLNKACETAPKMLSDGKTLIFSSNRIGGKGGYDLYQSKQNILNEWGIPVPLIFANTTKNDLNAAFAADENKLFLAGKNNGIYAIKNPEEYRNQLNQLVRLKVVQGEDLSPVEADIRILDFFTTKEISRVKSHPVTGLKTLILPAGKAYVVLITKNEFTSFRKTLDFLNVDSYSETHLDVELFKNVQVKIRVADSELFHELSCELIVRDEKRNEIFSVGKNQDKTTYELELPAGRKYNLSFHHDEFYSKEISLDFTGVLRLHELEFDVELIPKKVDILIDVKNPAGKNIEADVEFYCKTSQEIIRGKAGDNIALRTGKAYNMYISSRGYSFLNQEIDLSRNPVREISTVLNHLKLNEVFELGNVDFESNSSELSVSAAPILDRLLVLLKNNPSLIIEIAVHTDDVGSSSLNRRLSEKRAESVVSFLIDHGISKFRLVSKGFGESQPKVSNDSLENRERNRRVEIKVLSI